MLWVQSSSKLSPQDKKDLEKYTKYFVYKCVQVIVGARLGERARAHSKAVSSGADWFNLAIKDIQEVQNETKRALASQNTVLTEQSVCVEISLKTSEGDVMMLETWWLGVEEQSDPNVRVSYTVYNRMGILLKSLLCVTRVTPAYRLSRKQGPESYVICYRLYVGDPQVKSLGEGSQMKKIGAVPTPAGTVFVKVAYRTKMLISPKSSTRDLSVDLKDDHFLAELSPKRTNTAARPCHSNGRLHRQDSDDSGPGWVESEICATTFSSSPPDPYLHPGLIHNGNMSPGKHRRPSGEKLSNKDTDRIRSFSDCQKVGAFAPNRLSDAKSDHEDIPFISLLHLNEQDTKGQLSQNGNSELNGHEVNGERMAHSAGSDSNKSTTSHASAPEDFVMVELKTPFAAADSQSDLGKFYRDCQGAPPLTMFDSHPDVNETLNDVTNQLATFEANLSEFDDFVESLQPSE